MRTPLRWLSDIVNDEIAGRFVAAAAQQFGQEDEITVVKVTLTGSESLPPKLITSSKRELASVKR